MRSLHALLINDDECSVHEMDGGGYRPKCDGARLSSFECMLAVRIIRLLLSPVQRPVSTLVANRPLLHR
jgi:hypothetical protein